MTGEAVTLHVARNTALQRLPRSLAMPQEELAIAVVISSRAEERALRGEAALLVAGLAELPRVVTIDARR